MQDTLKNLTGQEISEADFTTDRLAILLKYLSQKSYWAAIERDLSERRGASRFMSCRPRLFDAMPLRCQDIMKAVKQVCFSSATVKMMQVFVRSR